ncbi:restriction endonuclease subunit S [Acidithiobacillus sp. AMEEHan]|uniref:restriction endonuclease subunit S n=1 Tax=Acidithiobacillus sp. AMEEHan TaxID=2994951 RepID=UPI0027E4D24B|nr:restriction endonuclease subunit S [Acidithiobacillus sp. AMEEHan]
MAGEWRTTSLGDLTVNHDGKRKPVKESDRRPGPYPYYGASGIVDYVDGYLFDGDYLLIAEDGENLRTRQTPIAFMACGKSWVNNHAHIVTGNEKADTRFLMYAIQGSDISGYLTGAVMPKLTQGNLNKIELECPPIEEQRAIAHILGTLDDKIELNRKQNETLEAMARALFKSWFVDFDPVRAKMEGRDPGLPKPLADLFPARLIDSELGEIPEGWEVKAFAETVEIIGGGTPKTSVAEYWNGDVPWFSVADAPPPSDVWTLDTEKKITHAGVENSSARVLPVGTTIISARGTVGRVALVGVPMTMNQSCYGLRGKLGDRGFFNYFATRQLVSILQQRTHGSVFDTITRDTLAGVQVVAPSHAVIKAFEALVSPMLDRIREALAESRTLAALRDTLLPKLISGELRVGAAQLEKQNSLKTVFSHP